MERETTSYSCPKCRRKIYVLADEVGDHGCNFCGWEPFDNEENSEGEADE